LIALRLSEPENDMKAPASLVDSIRSGADSRLRPVISLRWRTAATAYPGSAVIPVPIAVAPRLISESSQIVSVSRAWSSPSVVAKPWNSWPRVIGTASCSCVRPTFNTPWNSSALRPKAWRSSSSSASSVFSVKASEILSAVG
jgi:hypothetical protein